MRKNPAKSGKKAQLVALLDPPAERVDGKISADAACAPHPSVGDDFQEEICAELNTSAVQPSTRGELSRFYEQELETDMEARADYEAVRARSAKFGVPPAFADMDRKSSADAAGARRPSVGVDFPEEICAELSTSAVSPSVLPANSTPLSQLPSGDSPLESEDPSALNSQAFPAVIAAEPVAPLPGTQQVASSTALSTPNSLASASSGMSPR